MIVCANGSNPTVSGQGFRDERVSVGLAKTPIVQKVVGMGCPCPPADSAKQIRYRDGGDIRDTSVIHHVPDMEAET
jgi:hypothetical protein